MFHYDYKTENTCSQIISLDLDGNIVHNVSFMGGCRPTSCADQLAKAVRAAYETEKPV